MLTVHPALQSQLTVHEGSICGMDGLKEERSHLDIDAVDMVQLALRAQLWACASAATVKHTKHSLLCAPLAFNKFTGA